jgi:hypothetical protein
MANALGRGVGWIGICTAGACFGVDFDYRHAPAPSETPGAGGAGGGATTSGGGAGGAGGAAQQGGTTGGGGACATGDDCPGADTTCRWRQCVDLACVTADAAAGTACSEDGGVECDGAGACVKRALGKPCTAAAECVSGFCVDDFCCESACSDLCHGCAATPGACTPLEGGTDPDKECPAGVCDGTGKCASGAPEWALSYADTAGYNSINGVAADSTSHVIAGGYFVESITIDGKKLTAAVPGDTDGIVLKLTGAGSPVWIRQLGGLGVQSAIDVAVDSADEVLVAGSYVRSLLVDDLVFSTDANDESAFVVKLDGATGERIWAKSAGDTTSLQQATAVASAAGDHIVVTGWAGGAIAFGAPQDIVHYPSGTQAFVVRWDPNGQHKWSAVGKQAPPTASYGYGIAVDKNDNTIVAGATYEGIDFGCPQAASCPVSPCRLQAFVAKFDATGACAWVKAYGDTNDEVANHVAVDAQGNIVVVGFYRYWTKLGSEVLTAGTGEAAFVLKLDPAGTVLWARGHSSTPAGVAAIGAAVDPQGNVLTTGRQSYAVDYGGGPKQAGGGTDLFLWKLSPAGDHVWSQVLGGAGVDIGYAVATDKSGAVLLGGWCEPPANFGGNLLTGPGYSALVAKFDP